MKIIALELIGRFLAALTGSSQEVAFSLGVEESMSLLKRLYKSNPEYLDKFYHFHIPSVFGDQLNRGNCCSEISLKKRMLLEGCVANNWDELNVDGLNNLCGSTE